MSVDFSRYTVGDTVQVHCCDECARAHGVEPKTPPDSGVEPWPCEVCGHYGIGSLMTCKIGEWLRLQPNRLITSSLSRVTPYTNSDDVFICDPASGDKQ